MSTTLRKVRCLQPSSRAGSKLTRKVPKKKVEGDEIMYPFVSPAFGVPVDYVAVRAIFALPYLALPFPTAGRKRTKRAQTANIRSFLRATAISVGEPCRSHTLPWFFCVTYFTHRSCGFLEAALYSNFGWRFFALYILGTTTDY